jgi:hypothetical protein
MSIKIFNGYKLNKNMDYIEFMDFLKEFGKRVSERYDDIFDSKMMSNQCLIADAYIHGYPEILSNMSNDALSMKTPNAIANFHALELSRKDNYTDNFVKELEKCNLKIFTSSEDILILFNGYPAYKKIWENMPNIEEFAYFNNTDKPDHISEEKWNDRYERWDKTGIFDSNFMPKCITFEPLRDKFAFHYVINESIPSKRRRALNLSKVIWSLKYDQMCNKKGITRASDIMDLMKQHKDDEKKYVDELEQVMVDISTDDLKMEIIDIQEKYKNTRKITPTIN